MNIYFTKFWTKIWITRWELKFFVSSRWEPKPHFIGACLVPPLPCSSNRLNGAGVFIVYSGQMHTVGYFPIDIFPGVSWKGGGGAESKHRSMMLQLSLPAAASRKQLLLSGNKIIIISFSVFFFIFKYSLILIEEWCCWMILQFGKWDDKWSNISSLPLSRLHLSVNKWHALPISISWCCIVIVCNIQLNLVIWMQE